MNKEKPQSVEHCLKELKEFSQFQRIPQQFKKTQPQLKESLYMNCCTVQQQTSLHLRQSSKVKLFGQQTQSDCINQTENMKLTLNILVVGHTGIGKTTFIDLIQNQIATENTKKCVNKVQLKLIDTEGYTHQNHKIWYKNIKKLIHDKFNQHSVSNDIISDNKVLFIKKDLIFRDNRIHLCLFMLNGPKIQLKELQLIRKLSKLINLIPLLVLKDDYTQTEIQEIKEYQIDYLSKQIPDLYEFVDLDTKQIPIFIIIKKDRNSKNEINQKISQITTTINHANLEDTLITESYFQGDESLNYSDMDYLYQNLINYQTNNLILLTNYYYYRHVSDQQLKREHLNRNSFIRKIIKNVITILQH